MPDLVKPPSGLIPDVGGNVGCIKCVVAHLPLPALDFRANPTNEEINNHVENVAKAKGWGTGRDASGPYVICPACVTRSEEALKRILTQFNPKSRCPACGHDKVGAKYCTGLRADCELGAARGHIHRICRRCGYGWIEGCLNDPHTSRSNGKEHATA